MELTRYTWNSPKNVSKDAKYAIRRKNGSMEVALLFRTAVGEEWSLSTGHHAALVQMVNRVKTEATGTPGGAFYVNEYRQVIVPTGGEDDSYYYAGEYDQELEFHFEGKVISGRAVGSNGQKLNSGDEWEGIHPGIPYVLKAGGKDISFKHTIRPNVIREELLSNYSSASAAQALSARIRSVKGFDGGRIYINEHRHFFAPLSGEGGLKYVYVGDLLESDPWFPKWQPPTS